MAQRKVEINKDALSELAAQTVSAKVSAVVYEAMESYRWENRLSKSEVVVEALEAWVESHGLREAAEAKLLEEISNAAEEI